MGGYCPVMALFWGLYGNGLFPGNLPQVRKMVERVALFISSPGFSGWWRRDFQGGSLSSSPVYRKCTTAFPLVFRESFARALYVGLRASGRRTGGDFLSTPEWIGSLLFLILFLESRKVLKENIE